MNRLFIGIEGGATKTEGILINDIGTIHAIVQTGPSNPWVIGFDNVAKLLKTLIDDILAKGQVNWNDIISVVSVMKEVKEYTF
jgi:N-acetylglucosamine kinase-like BadF-type ATPase